MVIRLIIQMVVLDIVRVNVLTTTLSVHINQNNA